MAPTSVLRAEATLFGGLTPERFLRRHWQKTPLLVRGAFPGFRDPLSPDSLAELACLPEVESRLVLERGGSRPWQLIEGPQSPRRLRRLRPTHWTLLVQEANLHVPALAKLLDSFRFIPNWRVDDVMVSFAPRFGSVGPHLDSYDVFLIQGLGRRRWRIDTRTTAAFKPGLDLRILRRFRAEQEWLLESGDMLYLPPGVAHHGVALEDCLTYSVGFRAPSHADLVLGWLQQIANRIDRSKQYEDPGLRPQRDPGEIAAQALGQMRRIVSSALAPGDACEFARFAGEHLTHPKDPDRGPRRRAVSVASLRRRLGAGAALARRGASRLAFVRQGSGILLFADGRALALPRRLAFAGALLTRGRILSASALTPHWDKRGFASLVVSLVGAGVFSIRHATSAGPARNPPAAGSPRRSRRP
jgi:50S ribosomal protein L16 3-hydroxylase